ncbi:CBS domain-containing protein [Aurantimonas sp. VKM B-3413]|uniref:CBS domain-containing protein n=1 Tax=Aurantimonas sp. VKM B-3413 TaxID=2779401 RepID=UPI001E522861|nr:CBS domain-containing protein [Aurantimonas sp. VKM B-3413]MCB8840143.1 CBS domain-containing protein [Aurantimonas sp. VKM B-3413]
MSVGQILGGKQRGVVTLDPGVSVEEAARVMSEKRIGAIVLLGEGGRVDGIISERDIVRTLAKVGISCLTQAVKDVMTLRVTTCTMKTTVDEAMQIMTNGRFRHLPVCDGDELIGIISIGDVVKQKIEDAEREAREMRDYIAAG